MGATPRRAPTTAPVDHPRLSVVPIVGMTIKLYEAAASRSLRVRWTLLELGIEFEAVDAKKLIGTDEFRRIHPLAKVPAIEEDGRALFESGAICTYLCDRFPERGLIAQAGSWERALQEQWSYFALTEIEAWLWAAAMHIWRLPEAERVPAAVPQCDAATKAGLKVLDDALSGRQYLVQDRFSVADIIAAFSVNWARLMKLTPGFDHVETWHDRLLQREHCTLARPKPAP